MQESHSSPSIKIRLISLAVVALLAVAAGLAGFWYQSMAVDTSDPLESNSSQTIEPDEAPGVHSSYSLDATVYDPFFPQGTVEKITAPVSSAVIPHHLVAGSLVGSLFARLEDLEPHVVVIVGPNHRHAGVSPVISSIYDWRTPYGVSTASRSIIRRLVQVNLVALEENVIANEHSVSAIVPFVKRTWKNATVIPIIVKNNADVEALNQLAQALKQQLPKNSLVLASVDFSHYLPKFVAHFHDQLSLNVLETANFNSLKEIEVDSRMSLYLLMRYNWLAGSQAFHLAEWTNSAVLLKQPDLAETTSYILGYFTEGEPKTNHVASLQFFGDMMLDRNVARAMGGKGLDYIFEKLRGQENRFFWGMHMLVGNLEGPFAPYRVSTTKSIAFRFDPLLAKQLKLYGFDAFNLANNHTVDMGWKNVAYTRDVLAKNGLAFFGEQYYEDEDMLYVAGEKQNLPFKIAFIGLNNTDHPLDMDAVQQSIEKAKEKAKIVIINIHWGEEYKRISNTAQRDLAHRLINMGVDAIIGHHPHVVQEVEMYKDKPIFYSLGNFIFDQYFSQETQEGMSVGLIVDEQGVQQVHVFPYYAEKSQPRLMMGERREEFFDWLKTNSRLLDRKFEYYLSLSPVYE